MHCKHYVGWPVSTSNLINFILKYVESGTCLVDKYMMYASKETGFLRVGKQNVFNVLT